MRERVEVPNKLMIGGVWSCSLSKTMIQLPVYICPMLQAYKQAKSSLTVGCAVKDFDRIFQLLARIRPRKRTAFEAQGALLTNSPIVLRWRVDN